LLDRSKQILRRSFTPAIAQRQFRAVFFAKREYIGGFAQPAFAKKRLDLLGAQALDIERRARNEVFELFHCLRGAGKATRAAPNRIARLADRIRPTFRADFWKNIWLRGAIAARKVNIGDFGYHVPGAVNLHPVALAQIAPLPDRRAGSVASGDVILIVQRRVGYHHAAHGHRGKARHRAERASAPHLNLDLLKPGPGQFRRKLVRNRPAWRGRAKAKTALQRKVIDLVHHAVDVIAERRALCLKRSIGSQHRLKPLAACGLRVGGKAERRQPCNCR